MTHTSLYFQCLPWCLVHRNKNSYHSLSSYCLLALWHTFHLILIIPLWNRQKKYDSYFRGKGTEIRDPECFLLLTSPRSLTSLSVSPEVHTSSSAPSRLKPGSLDWSPSSLRLRPLPKTYVLSCSFKSQVFCNSLSGRKQKISVFLQAYILCLP